MLALLWQVRADRSRVVGRDPAMRNSPEMDLIQTHSDVAERGRWGLSCSKEDGQLECCKEPPEKP